MQKFELLDMIVTKVVGMLISKRSSEFARAANSARFLLFLLRDHRNKFRGSNLRAPHPLTSIDYQDVARNEIRRGTSEEDGGAGDIVTLPHAVERDGLGHDFIDFVSAAVGGQLHHASSSGDRTRCNAVDANAKSAPFKGLRASAAVDSRLGGAGVDLVPLCLDDRSMTTK